MQISNRVVIYCAAGLVLLSPIAFSADNPDQAKARRALDELNNREGGQPAAAQPATRTQRPTNTSAVTSGPAVSASDSTNELRDAVRRKMAELETGGGSTIQAPKVQSPAAATVPPPADAQTSDEAREALRRKMAELDAAPPAPSVAQPPTLAQPPAQPRQAPAVPAPAIRSQPSTSKKGDSEAIARAREAVRKKFAEIDAQEQQAGAQAPAVVQQPQAAPQQAPALQQAAPQDPASVEKTRELLRQKMAEMEAQQRAAKSTAPAATRPPAVDSRFSDLTTEQADARKAEEAREALRKKMESMPTEPEPKPAKPTKEEVAAKRAEEKAAREERIAKDRAAKAAEEKPAKAPAVAQEATTAAQKDAAATAKAQEKSAKTARTEQTKPGQKQPPQYRALQAPAVPFSEDQQTKLAELLRKYRADEITPDQYHAERAKIIGNR